MIRRLFISCVALVMTMSLSVGALSHNRQDGRLYAFRDLHALCERAYQYNDFVEMKRTLDERETYLEQNQLSGMSAEDSIEVLGMLYKDWGSYHACMVELDGTGYAKALENYHKSFGLFSNDGLSSSVIRSELAQLHYRSKEYDKALKYLEENYSYYERQYIAQAVTTLSQVAICKARLKRFESAETDIENAISICRRAASMIDVQESLMKELKRKKGKIIALKSESSGKIDEAIGCFAEYFGYVRDSVIVSFQNMDAEERERYWLRMHPFVVDCYRLEDAAPSLLYDVTLFSKNILMQFAGTSSYVQAPVFQDVQARLDDGECAIEFVRYQKCDAVRYGAIVLRNSGCPKFICLPEEKELLDFPIYGNVTVRDALKNKTMKMTDSLYQSRDFARLVWDRKLRKEISSMKKVYFAPDGIFHQIAIEYVYPDRTMPAFHRLTSTRELLNDRKAIDVDRMLLCGGIDYHKGDAEDMTAGNDALAYSLLRRIHPRFKDLEGSYEEVDSAYRMRSNLSDSLVVGKNVTESRCSALFGRYPVVMLSTHGYFGGNLSDFGEDLKPRTSDVTMSESVLILANAQYNMEDEDFDGTVRDGILSARELSAMDLHSVDLFIVSACQSGLGYITADGVYGIQRGLKNAGVKSMIVSLWDVDDSATKHFMINFNRALMSCGDVREAFEKARSSMDEPVVRRVRIYDRRKDTGRYEVETGAFYSRPRYKNAFVLIDNI